MEIFLATFSALFSVVNPLGAMPIFITLTEGSSLAEKRKQAIKISAYVIGILLMFFFAGNMILGFFGIQLDHIRIAGGLMISISAMSLLGKEAYKGKVISKEVQEESLHKEDITFAPMAMPLLSGPGAIALMIGMHDHVDSEGIRGYFSMILAVILVAIIIGLILTFSNRLNKFLGKAGMSALSRMMGFIVLSIGISMMLNGLVPLLKH
ncbi:MAG: MarC family protein [Reichenbachiella sp.]|uniref:MarC family protein n=1 Tax=Reichenbachiella sp. TaxID=2184521 RepID=UPI0032646923